MAFTAVYDADVLHPPSVRDLLLRLAVTGLFRARWSEQDFARRSVAAVFAAHAECV